ncbi:MAG TPA: CBS domain-containing protein [Gaiellaceae bacterium]|nr:CBS domain-containing protein [Gaiellaceae bacterium]
MVKRPVVHPPTASVGELRAFFDDDHVHMALLVADGILVAAVEREDLAAATCDALPALELGPLGGRTVAADTSLGDALAAMRRDGRRRLAVTGAGERLLGLLCLKASGRGFCSDADVSGRRGAASADADFA